MKARPSIPWTPLREGERPSTPRQRLHTVLHALRDLPRAVREDSVFEMAAGMAFFLLFSLSPAVVFLVALLPYLPLDASFDELLDTARPVLPRDVYILFNAHLQSLLDQPRTGLMTVSAFIALFSASRALVSLSHALNRANRVPVLRSEVLRRIRSMGLTLAALAGVVVAVVGLSLGDQVVMVIVRRGWLHVDQGIVITIVRWPILLFFTATLIHQLYFLLPDRRPRWRLLSVGSLGATLGWVGATWVFSRFISEFVKYNVTFGSLGTIAVLMAWLYLGCVALMLGGSLNALVGRGMIPRKPPLEESADDPADC